MIDVNGKRIKFHESTTSWIRSFSLESIKCLIVCRGPVRKEAIDVFEDIGIKEYGILLSEKDSIVYPKALAPELRNFKYIENIHRVPDYMGSTAEQKQEIIKQIINIAKTDGYTHIFAGYGFMAEDSEFIESIEKSGVIFMGPGSHVAKQAGSKDEAKKLARRINVSVTPGIDNISAITLVKKVKDPAGLEKLIKDQDLYLRYDSKKSLEDNAEDVLYASYQKGVDLITIAELQEEGITQCSEIWKKYPKNRIRLKYVGGGGGKGQRVIKTKEEVKAAVMEILAESKVTSVGSNRNFLIELNIENTRHNEIQMVGNGEWSIALGGRDCSLQMHEQKLLEFSYTVEMMEKEIAKHHQNQDRIDTIKEDTRVLRRMEEEAERFGTEVKLDSVSTFESIVEGTNNFFMEVNTRIQVEHRVTEMVYEMKFTNPDNKHEFFILDSLIETMALLSLHRKRVPKPERIQRYVSSLEARINATNQSLQPHAGGIIQKWSPPLEDELRDDQGIGIKNPDTGSFIHYRLAGAYDSNVALLITHGTSRRQNMERLSEIMRRTELRGQDLQTNLPVHYGLTNWILGKDPMFKPSTRFMTSYLAAVGALEGILKDVDVELAWEDMTFKGAKQGNIAKTLARKITLIVRPMKMILSQAHLLAGFIGLYNNVSWEVHGSKVTFLKNPILILSDLYHYLNLDDAPHKTPFYKIWDHDKVIMENAINFYKDLEKVCGIEKPYPYWEEVLSKKENPFPTKISLEIWEKAQASHKGFQLGLNILKIIPRIAENSNFLKLDMDSKLNAIIPDEFKDASGAKYIKFLSPPPKAKSDEIIAPMGGMFYSKESPISPVLINEGESFKAGQPLFIIEVMKMFNKVSAPFSGKVVKNFLHDSDGKIVSKGQLIFKIEPDEFVKEETPTEILERKKKVTLSLLD